MTRDSSAWHESASACGSGRAACCSGRQSAGGAEALGFGAGELAEVAVGAVAVGVAGVGRRGAAPTTSISASQKVSRWNKPLRAAGFARDLDGLAAAAQDGAHAAFRRRRAREGSASGNVASSSRRLSRSASQPAQRKREAPLTSVPRSRSSRMRGSSLPVTPSMCSTSSRIGISCTTTGVSEMDSAASELSFTRTVCGNAMV